MARQFRSERQAVPSSRDTPSGRGRGGGGGGSYYTHEIEGGEGAEEKGEWKWMSAPEATRNELGVADIRRYMMGVSKPRPLLSMQSEQQRQPTMKEKLAFEPVTVSSLSNISKPPTAAAAAEDEKGRKGIFTSLTFYINGSTYPTISDHKLKRLLAEEGGNISLYLARKSVTHVILGAAATSSLSSGAAAGVGSGGRKTGGLLSAGKMQKEVLSKTSGFGKGVKYVNVEWCVNSLSLFLVNHLFFFGERWHANGVDLG